MFLSLIPITAHLSINNIGALIFPAFINHITIKFRPVMNKDALEATYLLDPQVISSLLTAKDLSSHLILLSSQVERIKDSHTSSSRERA